jgi:hypothetical protein
VQLPRVTRKAARLPVIIIFSTRIKIKTLEKRPFPSHDPKLKIRLYRIYLFYALFFKVMLKLIFRNLEKTLPIRNLRYRIFFPKKVKAYFVNNESDYEESNSDSNNDPDFCGHIDINL